MVGLDRLRRRYRRCRQDGGGAGRDLDLDVADGGEVLVEAIDVATAQILARQQGR